MPRNEDLPDERIVITYEDYTGDALEKVELPFKLLLCGDYSMGTSMDREQDIEVRRIRDINEENLNAHMKEMGIHLNLKVPNVLVNGDEELNVDVPIEGMHSFSPDSIARTVPAMKTLMDIRDALKEIGALASNDRNVLKLLEEVLKDPAAAKRLARYKVPSAAEVEGQPPATE